MYITRIRVLSIQNASNRHMSITRILMMGGGINIREYIIHWNSQNYSRFLYRLFMWYPFLGSHARLKETRYFIAGMGFAEVIALDVVAS